MITGAITATAIMILLSAISAALISKTVIPEQSTGTIGIAVCLTAGFIGSLVAGRVQKGKLLITCLGSSAMYLLLLILMKAAFFGNWDQLSLPMAAGILAAGLAASFVPTGKRTHHKKR